MRNSTLEGVFQFFLLYVYFSHRGMRLFKLQSIQLIPDLSESPFFIFSLIGTVVIFGGMYTVLWGKAEEVKGEREEPTETVGVSEITISLDGKEDHGEHSTRRPLLVNTHKIEI